MACAGFVLFQKNVYGTDKIEGKLVVLEILAAVVLLRSVDLRLCPEYTVPWPESNRATNGSFSKEIVSLMH